MLSPLPLLLGTFCSHSAPQDLVSHGEELNISFSSNSRVVDTGFLASWKAVDPTSQGEIVEEEEDEEGLLE